MRIGDSLAGKRVLVTQADDFMGPVLCEVFAAHGAQVIADKTTLGSIAAGEAAVRAAGEVDVVIANLGVPAPTSRVADVTDEEWRHVFAHIVDPLPGIARAVLPQMTKRRAGKIVVMGSATAFRGQKRTSVYSAARGAQASWVRAVGTEVAPDNVHVNLIAQNFVENPMYYGPEVQALPAFQERLRREVPLGRLATAQEDAMFAVFLASSEVSFFAGQSIPFAGGWAT
ncbi:SDR family oxidoreductase [Quisquiliibacterium transsilvanicum]|uniref:NAD(P)-dependent dehydrogenase (Short-subunit alcohol dehydrogenase family) n=1 Tax=Quisquiliibacterium transsilvanicum TaxID=1549638 RepID=A0A7W8HI95_9BURK|nr:SDR family oxidoreductase [Quisquiliibacterium transsilvanicum]MBB5272559.1 NAD(P)-dependent dehydrogenase (short-subunit alcohol dehydrogenase family) [Quisquiliibacterium transsilvanicum]